MSASTTPVSQQLAAVADQLGRIIERIEEASTRARSLSAATDWKADAATAFHDKAELWADEVARFTGLAEQAKLDLLNARDRAALREADEYAAAFAPAGAR